MLSVKNLNKNFKLYQKPSDRLAEFFFRKKKHTMYPAISGVSFELNEGESLGVIGPNGAGKSTLMKLLTGLLILDEGEISTDGKITGLIELGTGFNPELSGEVNIRNNAFPNNIHKMTGPTVYSLAINEVYKTLIIAFVLLVTSFLILSKDIVRESILISAHFILALCLAKDNALAQ